jgi:hypothetical protein
MRTPATEESHLVSLGEMVRYVGGMTAATVDCATTAALDAAYNAGTMELTSNNYEELEVDGHVMAAGERLLVKNSLDATENGIFVMTQQGSGPSYLSYVLERAADMNTGASLKNGLIVPVAGGDTMAGTKWKLTPAAVPAVLGSTALHFSREVTDFTKVVEEAFPIAGDASTLAYVFAHNWGTRNVTHEIYEDATGATVMAAFRRIDANSVRVSLGTPLGAGNDCTLVLRAQVDPA